MKSSLVWLTASAVWIKFKIFCFLLDKAIKKGYNKISHMIINQKGSHSFMSMKYLKVTGSRKNIMESEYYQLIADLVKLEEVQNLKLFRHHIMTNRFQHCLNVSYYNYQLCRFFRLDADSAARAGLLHDLYFYETKQYCQEKHEKGHCAHHPCVALENAEKLIRLNDKERDMIVNHMWPMTSELPKYAETWLITIADKYAAVLEFLLPQPGRFMKFLKHHAHYHQYHCGWHEKAHYPVNICQTKDC